MNAFTRIFLALISLSTCFAQAQTTPPPAEQYLEKMQSNFENSLAQIRGDDQAAVAGIQRQYAQNLLKLEAQYQKTGALEPLLKVRNEMTRFKAAKTVAIGDWDATDTPELERIAQGHAKLFADNTLKTSRAISALTDKLQTSLETLQSKYTQVNMIEEAIKVKDHREKIDTLDFVVDAREVVANANQLQRVNQQERARMVREQAQTKKFEGPVANKFKGSDKKRIGDRYEDFIDSLVEDKLDETVGLVNPHIVEKSGSAALKIVFAAFVPQAQILKKLGGDLRTGDIDFAADGQTAIQTPYVDSGKKGKDGDPVLWVKVDGDWYIDFK